MNRTHIDIDAEGNQTERPYTLDEEADADIRQAEAEAWVEQGVYNSNHPLP